MRKNKLKTIINIGTAILMAGVLSGCSVKFGTKKEPKLSAVVAHPTNGAEGMDITYEMFRQEYRFYLTSNDIEDDTLDTVAYYTASQRRTIINNLIIEQVALRKAEEMGVYELTEEEQKEVDDSTADLIKQYIKYFGELAASELAANGSEGASSMTDEEKEEEGNRRLDELLEKCGMTRDDLRRWVQSGKITEKLQALLAENVTYSMAEESFKEFQKSAEELYNNDVSQYTMAGYDQMWLPAGSRQIKHILIGFDDDLQKELKTLRADGKDDEADKKRAEAAEALKEKQEEIEKKLDEGGKLDDLIKEYSADADGSAAYPDGYTVIPNGVTYMDEFQKAAFVPEKIGDRTTCVTDYGVHIMVYVGDAKISDEAIKEFTDFVFDQLKQKEYSDRMTEWMEEYDFDIDYEALRLVAPEEESSDAA